MILTYRKTRLVVVLYRNSKHNNTTYVVPIVLCILAIHTRRAKTEYYNIRHSCLSHTDVSCSRFNKLITIALSKTQKKNIAFILSKI